MARGEIGYVFSENVANAGFERVMRQYAENGNTLIVGEVLVLVARRAAYPQALMKPYRQGER